MDDNWIRRLTAGVVLLVALIAGAISFTHISDLARAHGQPAFASLLLPLSVDGAIVASGLVMLHAARRRKPTPPLARCILILAVGATVGANLAYGLAYGALGGIISSWPAISFIGCVELIMGMVRSARRADEAETPEVAPAVILRTFASHVAQGVTPTIREIKAELNVGQPKAVWVRDWLAALNEAA